MRTFEFTDAKSRKFWNIDVQGNAYTVTSRRIGTAGQSRTKSFATPAAAQTAANKLIREKTKQGFVETTPKALPPEEEAFQKALVENPDDLAGWCAYADYLVEHDDPRGEFMQVQIALGDEKRRKKERDALKMKESELFKAHEKEWLGGLAPFVFEDAESREIDPTYTRPAWERGVVSSLVVGRLNMALAQTLASDPAARFVRELHVHDTLYGEDSPHQSPPRVKTPEGVNRHSELFELIGSPLFANLRHFQMGGAVPEPDGWCDCHTGFPEIEHVVASMPRIEVLDLYCKYYESADLFKLTNLTNLRELRIYHLGGYQWGRRYEYAIDVLATNPSLANLTHLLFHPHQPEGLGQDERYHSYLPLEQIRLLLRSKHLKKLTHLQLRLSDMGDDGIREFIASGILKQLKWLDLQHGGVTDEGARLLAACEDAKRLERIDLSRNAVTSKGLNALRKAKVNAVANKPLTAREVEERQYLNEGDFE